MHIVICCSFADKKKIKRFILCFFLIHLLGPCTRKWRMSWIWLTNRQLKTWVRLLKLCVTCFLKEDSKKWNCGECVCVKRRIMRRCILVSRCVNSAVACHSGQSLAVFLMTPNLLIQFCRSPQSRIIVCRPHFCSTETLQSEATSHQRHPLIYNRDPDQNPLFKQTLARYPF